MADKRYRRIRPAGIYLLLLMITVGAYWLYSLLIVPVVEPQGLLARRSPIPISNQPLPDDNEHHQWFEPGDWELEECPILHTAQGKILFQDYAVEDPQTWFVKPFSLVLERENDLDADRETPLPPLILRCEKGARLFFDSPVLAKFNSSGNRLESAFLEGQVELYRMATSPDKNDAIRIETSNVQITDEQIITIDDVAFWFGPNQGIGRNLLIQLTHSNYGASVTRDFSKINGIRNLQLGFLSSLRLHPAAKAPPKDRDRMLSTDTSPIEITAAGSFEFDLESNLARFVDHVQVRKLDSSGDALHCDELLLKFKSTDGAQVIKLDAAADTEFQLESVTAVGKPAVLEAHSQNAQVAAELLEYDLANQTIKASGSKPVDIRKDANRFLATSIYYRLTDDKTLGPLRGQGPGLLIRKNGEQNFRVSWDDLLTADRLSDQKHRITISGNTELKLDEQNSIRAKQLEFDVWEVPVFDQDDRFVRWNYQPDHVIAENQVQIASEKMIGNTQRLIAKWPSNPKAAPQAVNEVGQINSELGSRLARANRIEQAMYVRRVNYDRPIESIPLHVSGNEIKVVLEDRNRKTEMIDLKIDGEVVVSKPADQPNLKAFEVHGSSLHLVPQGQDIYQIRVSGNSNQSARIFSDRMNLTGPEIFLDQQQNQMWVSGSGNLKIIGDDQTTKTAAVANSGVRRNDGDVDVTFEGGMVFEGLMVYFERNISARINQANLDGTISHTRATAAALSLTLDRRIEFQNSDKSKSKANPKIVEMIMRDSLPREKVQFKLANFQDPPNTSVVIINQTINAQGNVAERITVRSPHAVLNEASQQIVAHGPGSIEIVRRDKSGSRAPGLGFHSNPIRENKRNGLTYVHTKFDKKLIANTKANEVVITGNTRSIYSTVTNMKRSFDPDRPGRLPKDAIQLNCEQIDMTQSLNGFNGQLDNRFVASGNARIRSETFDTAADQIRYDEQQDLLTVESTTGRDIVLNFRRDKNSSWDQIVGAKLNYRLSDQFTRIEKVGRVSATIGNRP